MIAVLIIVITYWGGRTVNLIGQVKKQKQTIQEFQVKEQKQNEELQKLLEKQKKLEKEKAELQKRVQVKSVRIASVQKVAATGACYDAMKQVFPQSQWANATAIIKAESGGNPNAVSRTNDHGCFQMNRGYQSWGRAVYDPLFNAKVAYRMYCARGWAPWVTARKLGLL